MVSQSNNDNHNGNEEPGHYVDTDFEENGVAAATAPTVATTPAVTARADPGADESLPGSILDNNNDDEDKQENDQNNDQQNSMVNHHGEAATNELHEEGSGRMTQPPMRETNNNNYGTTLSAEQQIKARVLAAGGRRSSQPLATSRIATTQPGAVAVAGTTVASTESATPRAAAAAATTTLPSRIDQAVSSSSQPSTTEDSVAVATVLMAQDQGDTQIHQDNGENSGHQSLRDEKEFERQQLRVENVPDAPRENDHRDTDLLTADTGTGSTTPDVDGGEAATGEGAEATTTSAPDLTEEERGTNDIETAAVSLRATESQPQTTAEPHQSYGLVTATPIEALVMAEAVQVTIDEERNDNYNDAESRNNNNHIAPQHQQLSSKIFSWKNESGRLHLKLLACILLFVVAGTVLAIAIPLSRRSSKTEIVTNTNGPSPAAEEGPVFDYPCYTSSFQILLDQLNDVNHVNDTYTLCPNTTIYVGVFANPEADEFYFVNGDYPIWVVRPNITIQCGIDGKSANNCTIYDGFLQVTANPIVPLPPSLIGSPEGKVSGDLGELALANRLPALENVTIRGITFSGQIRHAGPFMGMSVLLSQPGDFTLEDCHWKQMSLSAGLIGAYRNMFLILRDVPLPENTISARIIRSTFTDIRYDNPLVIVISQFLEIEDSIFDRLKISALVSTMCRIFLGQGDVEFMGGCAGILYCAEDSFCSMSNSCVKRSTFTGPSIVNFVHNTTNGVMNNNFLDASDYPLNDETCELALGTQAFYARPEDAIGSYSCAPAFEADTCNSTLQ